MYVHMFLVTENKFVRSRVITVH